LQSSFASKSVNFQSSQISQENLKQLTVQEQLYQLSERDCIGPVEGENSCKILYEQERLKTDSLRYRREL